MLPLLVAAIAAGGIKGIAGIAGGAHQKKVAKRAIKANYRRNERDLGKSQQDIRNSSNESLAERGLLNASSSPRGAVGSLEQAYATGGPLKGRALPGTTTKESAWRARSNNGGVGLADTIAGGLSDTMSKEFYQEHEDLWRDQKDQLKGLPSTASIVSQGVAGGISTGMGLYSAFAGGGSGAAAGAAAPPAASVSGGSGMPGAFGVDVVNPLNSPNYSLTAPVTFRPPTAPRY